MLFLTFFQPSPKSSHPHEPSSEPSNRREALTVGITLLTAIFVVFLTSLAVVFTSSTNIAQVWANILGTTAGILSMIQWVPQIYETWKRGSIGSLSILTMIIQVPGAFMFAFSLWLRVGWEGWSTWLVFVITGCLQGSLLGLAIYYWVIGRRQVREEVHQEITGEGVEEDAVDERTGLLANGHGNVKRGPEGSNDHHKHFSTYESLPGGGNRDSGGERIT